MGFALLHSGLQRRLYDMQWPSLRPIQDAAIQHLMGPGGDCVIAAPTAGGKTEAAFLPILSSITANETSGVAAMYVGPLKALINDQFGRIEDLCCRLDLPVHKWHGDVGDSHKRAVLRTPKGVLLITPESLEAMFVLRPSAMPALFGQLRYVVIDEMHAFLGSVRGTQLISQLFRLQRRCGCNPVRVGLSATLGDPAAASAWLRPNGTPATYITDSNAGRSVSMRVSVISRDEEADDEKVEAERDHAALSVVARSILRSCHKQTNLAFANAKSRIEELADCLKHEAQEMGLRHEVVVHHGSLSKETREWAEERLRQPQPCTAACSNTLEMGINIGQIDAVIQVSPPWSVSSLAQRMGRSGRKEGAPAVLRAFFVETEPNANSSVWDRLHLESIRGVAMIELMLAKFAEPGNIARRDWSTLIHQLLSTLAELGGARAADLFARINDCGAFGKISQSEFATLLRALAQHRLIEQMAEGDLILGASGERMRDHFSFYAAFASEDEFRVLHGSEQIGMLPAKLLPASGEYMLLGGRRWLVQELDVETREVHVVPGKGRRPPKFSSFGGDMHPRVHQQMLALLTSTGVPAYLDENAQRTLQNARKQTAALNGFSARLVDASPKSCHLFVFGGGRIQRTLLLVLRSAGFILYDEGVGFSVAASSDDVRSALERFGSYAGDGLELASLAADTGARAAGDKFDVFLPEALWCAEYAKHQLDLNGARDLCAKILRE
jgi:ATP-dependent Lhr-like helicase